MMNLIVMNLTFHNPKVNLRYIKWRMPESTKNCVEIIISNCTIFIVNKIFRKDIFLKVSVDNQKNQKLVSLYHVTQ